MAQEFGDHPDTALPRMCWARQLVSQVYELHVPAALLDAMLGGRVDAPAAAAARATIVPQRRADSPSTAAKPVNQERVAAANPWKTRSARHRRAAAG
jgi:hypothetical protein